MEWIWSARAMIVVERSHAILFPFSSITTPGPPWHHASTELLTWFLTGSYVEALPCFLLGYAKHCGTVHYGGWRWAR